MGYLPYGNYLETQFSGYSIILLRSVTLLHFHFVSVCFCLCLWYSVPPFPYNSLATSLPSLCHFACQFLCCLLKEGHWCHCRLLGLSPSLQVMQLCISLVQMTSSTITIVVCQKRATMFQIRRNPKLISKSTIFFNSYLICNQVDIVIISNII